VELAANADQRYFAQTLSALRFGNELYALPLAYKSVALFYNPDLIATPPKTTEELVALAKKFSSPKEGRFGLGLRPGNCYDTAGFFFGYGGGIFRADGELELLGSGNAAALAFLRDLVLRERVVPEEANMVLVTKLFNEGRTPMVISGPWFVG